MTLETDTGVVFAGGRGGEEDEGGVDAGGLVGAFEKFLADAESLELHIHREVGEIGAVGEVGERPGDADQLSVDAGGGDNVGPAQHAFEDVETLDGAAFGQGAGDEYGLELFDS